MYIVIGRDWNEDQPAFVAATLSDVDGVLDVQFNDPEQRVFRAYDIYEVNGTLVQRVKHGHIPPGKVVLEWQVLEPEVVPFLEPPCPAGGVHHYVFMTAQELEDDSGRLFESGWYCSECMKRAPWRFPPEEGDF